jgi:uncharacterized membrane protein
MNYHNMPFLQGVGLIGIIIGVLIGFAIFLLPMVFYILTLQKALNKCAPENRAMEPAVTWLLIIPCFGLIWHFFVVMNMSKSLAAEFQKRGVTAEPEPGKMLGLIMCILAVCSIIPLLGPLCALGSLVCWVIYWVKIAEFSKKLGA